MSRRPDPHEVADMAVLALAVVFLLLIALGVL